MNSLQSAKASFCLPEPGKYLFTGTCLSPSGIHLSNFKYSRLLKYYNYHNL